MSQNEERLESLLRIIHHPCDNIHSFLDFVLEEAISLTDSEIGYIYFYNENDKKFILNSWSKQVMHQCAVTDPQTVYELEKTGLWGEAVRQRKPILINDFDSPHPLKKGLPDAHAPLTRFLTIPVLSDDKIVAVVGVANKKTDYGKADIRQLQLIMDAAWKMVERQRHMALLNVREKEYRKLFQSMTSGCSLQALMFNDAGDPVDYCTLDMNPAAERLLEVKKEDIVNVPVSHVLSPAEFKKWLEIFSKVALTGNSAAYEQFSEHNNKHFSGRVFSPSHGHFAVIFDDVTEQKKTETILLNSQKLESIGILAGGIAHDFNNMLGAFFGYIDLAIELTQEPPVVAHLKMAEKSLQRAQSLTGQLLTYSKNHQPHKRLGALFPFIEDTVRFALSGSNITASYTVEKNLWHCKFDENQIAQVIDNLIINAKYAMPAGGSIQIDACNSALTDEAHPILSPGPHVKISIRDHGSGIPKEIMAHIFDPFFTTKETGHGLGLATSHTIVKKHNGFIDAESIEGQGSTFHIYLPAVIQEAASPKEPSNAQFKDSGVFLLLEDDDLLRESTSRMLSLFGYDVVAKRCGSEILEYLNEGKTDRQSKYLAGMLFDLTISGGMGGRQTTEAVRARDLKVPVFATSGYAEDPIMANPQRYGFTASIPKPFKKSQLAEMLKQHMRHE